MIRIILLMFILTGCGFKKDPRSIKYTDPVLQPYVDKFEYYYGKVGDIPIAFSNLGSASVGRCTKFRNGKYKEIALDASYWYRTGLWADSAPLTEPAKTQLIFHEFGHCFLNREHDATYMENPFPDGVNFSPIPKSFMFPYVFRPQLNLLDYYIEELRND